MEAKNQRGDCSEMSEAIDHAEADHIARDAVAGNAIYSRRLLARAYLDRAAEIERLRIANARLREALAPFAEIAAGFGGKTQKERDWWAKQPVVERNWPIEGQVNSYNRQAIYERDFQRARTAMEASNGNQ